MDALKGKTETDFIDCASGHGARYKNIMGKIGEEQKKNIFQMRQKLFRFRKENGNSHMRSLGFAPQVLKQAYQLSTFRNPSRPPRLSRCAFATLSALLERKYEAITHEEIAMRIGYPSEDVWDVIIPLMAFVNNRIDRWRIIQKEGFTIVQY